MAIQPQYFCDQDEVDETDEADVELAEPIEAPSEQPFDLVSSSVDLFVKFPSGDVVPFWKNHGREAQIQSQLTVRLAFVGSVSDEMNSLFLGANQAKQILSFDGVVFVARRDREKAVAVRQSEAVR